MPEVNSMSVLPDPDFDSLQWSTSRILSTLASEGSLLDAELKVDAQLFDNLLCTAHSQ